MEKCRKILNWILGILSGGLGVTYGVVSNTKEFQNARNWFDGNFIINFPTSRLLTIIIFSILIWVILSLSLYFVNNYLKVKNQNIELRKKLNENQNSEKSNSIIFKSDIERSIKFVKMYINSDLKCVVTDKISLLDDYKIHFDSIAPKLSKLECTQLIDFYIILADIKDVQNDCKLALNDFFNNNPSLNKTSLNYIKIPGKKSYDKSFNELVQRLANSNIDELMLALDKI